MRLQSGPSEQLQKAAINSSGNLPSAFANQVLSFVLQEGVKSKPVLLVISLAGVKVCSPDGKVSD